MNAGVIVYISFLGLWCTVLLHKLLDCRFVEVISQLAAERGRCDEALGPYLRI